MKKLFVLVLLVAFLMTSAAFAEGFVASPSVRPSQVLATLLLDENGAPVVDDGFEIVIIEKNERVIELGTELVEFLQTAPIHEYFGQELFAEAIPLMPENCAAEDYQLNEFEAIEQHGYAPEMGDAGAVFEFAEDYPSDAVLLAFVGIEPIAVEGEAPAEGEEAAQIAWTPLPAFVDNGKVVVVFSQDVLTKMMDENINTVLTVLQAR